MEEALKICDELVDREYIPSNVGVEQQRPEHQPPPAGVSVGGFFGAIYKTVTKVGNTVAQKAMTLKDNPTVQALGQKTVHVMDKTASAVQNGTTAVLNSSAMQSAKTKAKDVGNYAEAQYKKINENSRVQQIKQDTKE